MLSFSLLLFKNLALLVVTIYAASQFRVFYQLFLPTSEIQSKSYLAIFYGLLGLLGAWLNLDFFPVIVGGLSAGTLVGLGAGLIAALPYLLKGDSLTLVNCMVLISGGIISGLMTPSREVFATHDGYLSQIKSFIPSKLLEQNPLRRLSKYTIAFLVIVSTMGVKFSLLPLISPPPIDVSLPRFIGEAGLSFFAVYIGVILAMRIIEHLLGREEYIIARQAHKTLQIADETLAHLRDGLTEESASATAEVILEITNASAVAITDKESILAYKGLASDHHRVGGALLTRSTKEVLTTGTMKVIDNRKDIGCPFPGCPLETAIVVPLRSCEKTIGTLKLYLGESSELTSYFVALASGLGNILSIQLELAQIAHLEQLTTEAELKALQAQINPHFLFNTLNTIASYLRTKPEVARELLVNFADFFRRSFNQPKEFVSLTEELEYIDAYLMFEKARFGDRLIIQKDIEEQALTSLLPPLILQPIVENAVKHGASPKNDTSHILIQARRVNGELELLVKDDGVGITASELKKIFTLGYGQGIGVGMNNVNERLKAIYGEKFSVEIFSKAQKGTTVSLKIPQRMHQ